MPADHDQGAHRLLFRLLTVQVCLLIVLAGGSAYLLHSLYVAEKRVISTNQARYRSYLLADRLRQSSDDLTRMVRTYAATGNPIFERQFRDVLAIRDGTKPRPDHYDRIYWDFMAVENPTAPFGSGEAVSLQALMREAGFTHEEFSLLAESKQRSDRLVDLEETAFNAMQGKFLDPDGGYSISGQPDRQLALQILFGKEYHQAKKGIMEPINEFLQRIDERTQRQVARQGARARGFLTSLMISFIVTIAITLGLLGTTYRYHRLMVGELRNANDEKSERLVKINELVEELESKNAALERFTYTVSHELKAPLITISGFAGQSKEDLRFGYRSCLNLLRHELIVDELDQLGDAELVHAGFVLVCLDAERFVQALRQTHGNDSRRLKLVGRRAVLPELGQHLLNRLICLGRFKGQLLRPAGIVAANQSAAPQDFPKEGDPIGILGKQFVNLSLNCLVLFVVEIHLRFTHFGSLR